MANARSLNLFAVFRIDQANVAAPADGLHLDSTFGKTRLECFKGLGILRRFRNQWPE
jgi:hypothetical protein